MAETVSGQFKDEIGYNDNSYSEINNKKKIIKRKQKKLLLINLKNI